MPRGPAIRTPERKEMRLRYSLGQSPNTIAGAMDRSRTGVLHILDFEEDAQEERVEPRGRKKILTERAKRHIGFYVSRNLSATCSEIIAALNLNVSVSTITRFLREDHEYIPMKKKPALTETHKINRRECIRKWFEDCIDWSKVVISDEKALVFGWP